MKSLQGKVGAVTGAGSGIGRALTLELARRGCAVAASDIDPAGLAETQRQLRALDARCTTAVVDVADRAAVFAWADTCRQEHGQVNLAVNNAGVALAAPAESVLPEDFAWLMGINFWGVVHGTQAFLPHLRASGDGHLVNISSIFGIMSMPTQSAYNASKFAVRGYTEALRMELELEGAPVGVTCVHPGGVATNIATAQRVDPRIEKMTGMSAQAHRRQAQLMIDRTRPDAAARQILDGVQRNARRVVIGSDAHFMDLVTRMFGAGYQALVIGGVRRMRAKRA